MTPTELQVEAQRLVEQLDAVVDLLEDATLVLNGVLDAAAIEEPVQVLDDAGEDLEHTHAALCAMLKQVQP